MKKQSMNLSPKKNTHHVKYGVSFTWAFTGTLLIASSIVQASDMQIYAVPTAGKKTIVMMLDTSGSMGYTLSSGYSLYDDYGLTSNSCSVTYSASATTPSYNRYYCSVSASTTNTKVKDPASGCEVQSNGSYRCYDRLSRLKDGMFAFLDSNNPTLDPVRVGLGHFSGYNIGTTSGDGSTGEILVAAKALGAVGSAQRTSLKNAVAGLVASNGTPSAHAYAEAAAYLMGSSTYSEDRYDIRKDSFIKRVRRSNGQVNYSYCTQYRNNDIDYNNLWQDCRSSSYWSSWSTSTPSDFSGGIQYGTNRDSTYDYFYYYVIDTKIFPDTNSGIPKSKNRDTTSNPDIVVNRSAADVDALYQSPLPSASARVSCDGQGIYFLSDGAANSSGTSEATKVMSKALGNKGTGFSCSGGLSNTGSDSAWDCMGEFAKKLYNGGQIQSDVSQSTNPVNVPIQTAFVGFGSVMNNLTAASGAGDARNACRISSRTQADRSGDDKCSPNQPDYAVNSPGYGNGGFFPTQSSSGVTDSVISFINNLGATPLEPLTTGAISVPADALSPSGLQPYGYLRALEPDPQSNKLIWAGNLKRYKVILSGANAGAFGAADGTTLVFNKDGSFRTNTKDLWNSISVYNNKSYADGGIIGLGGAYSRVPMPITGQTENLLVTPKKYEFLAQPNALRTLFTDIASTGGATLAAATNGASLLRIPAGPIPQTGVPAYVLNQFNTQDTLKDIPIFSKQKLLNYLGFSVPLDSTATSLPTPLTLSSTPHLAMGGSIHSFPVQLTYSGTLDSMGNLTSTRSQSILYGTMDGGLHLVDSQTGVEQMVFVPSELLRNTTASKALVKGEGGPVAPMAGLDGAWVADSLYTAKKASSPSDENVVKARQMNVYGGLRMGGESYYALDVLDPTSPKFLFRVGRDQSDFSRMGQSWSKPVLANVRIDNQIKRVMIVGGGYDQCYENPKFSLGSNVSTTEFPDTSCNNKTAAQGNAVYMIDAKNGALLWWTSNTGANTNNANMKHSIVSRISAIDRDGDGLIDHLYFGDLGGQAFRADLNNTVGTTKANFGKRVVRLANLATDASGNALSGGKNPRFYEAPTVTIHDQGSTTFMLIGLASGNRSTPLDVFPLQGREGMLPYNSLNDRLVNNVYGVIDRDFIKRDLITGTPTISTQDINLATMQKNPQLLTGNIPSVFIGTSPAKNGWYRSLSSNSKGQERADNTFRVPGGMKAFEEPIAVTGNFIVPVYDPQGTGIEPKNPCLPRVVGETDRQRYCLPFGVCINSNGTVNSSDEEGTGFKTKTENCPANVVECNDNTLGAGIVGITPVPREESAADSCPDITIAGNEKGSGLWKCVPTINPTKWYERWKK
ncbi:PilC/PilY family type IV pilus protein [Acinetobacter venetianus]|uniref:PilC/PilY family type IV pilus protein n=1 Tax=Acinetobacter venetianus TaxID=52133 RepID=UPI00214FB33D|nr:PilC/PilY family type IV pilus protein [Acinetobacter venetianus]MCR4529445.1 PilC/PilY family type IV pilus protein [Acinetobacter venetianus]